MYSAFRISYQPFSSTHTLNATFKLPFFVFLRHSKNRHHFMSRVSAFPEEPLHFSPSSSEQLVSQRMQCEKKSPGQALNFSTFQFSFFHPASIGLTADGVRAFPVEHLKFSLSSSEQLVSQRTDMRKFPGQTLIFPSCQVSSFRPASISLTADGVRAFPVEHLKFSLSSSEQLVSQRMEYEKSPGQTLIFPSCQVSSFRPASIGLTADGARAFPVEHLNFLSFIR